MIDDVFDKEDSVNSPPHYLKGRKETIEYNTVRKRYGR